MDTIQILTGLHTCGCCLYLFGSVHTSVLVPPSWSSLTSSIAHLRISLLNSRVAMPFAQVGIYATISSAFKRDPAKNPEFALSRLRARSKKGLVYIEGLYTHVITGDSVVGRRVATKISASTLQNAETELAVPIGDCLASVQVRDTGLRFTTLFDHSMTLGECPTTATTATTTGASNGVVDASGALVPRFPDDASVGVEALVTPFGAQSRLIVSLDYTRSQLRFINNSDATKGKLRSVFRIFFESFEEIASWVMLLGPSNAVSVVPHLAALDRVGRKAIKRVGFFLLRPWLGMGSSKLALEKLRKSIHRLNEHKTTLFGALASCVAKQKTEDTEGAEIVASFASTLITDGAYMDMAIMYHETLPRRSFKVGMTDRLLTYFIGVDNASELDRVARADAATRGITLQQAMADFAKRVPAIRLAIKGAHVSVLTWLIQHAKLECINPPEAPLDPRLSLSLEDHDLSTIELAKRVEGTAEREFITSLLSTVVSIRRFTQNYISIIEREPDATPIRCQDLMNLANDMTKVTQLSQLESLASSYFDEDEQLEVMLTAFAIALDRDLVKTDDTYHFYITALERSCNGRVPKDRRKRLKHRARKINQQSAKWVIELQRTVSELQVASFNHNLRLIGAERSIAFLQECLIDMQRDVAEAEDRRRFVSVVSMVLSSVCAPVSHAIDLWLGASADPIGVLHMIMNASTDVERFITEGACAYGLQTGVHEALQSLQLDSSAVVTGLRTAARRDLADEGYVLDEDEETMCIMPEDDDSVTGLIVMEKAREEAIEGTPRRQLYLVVLDVIAAMKKGSAA